MRKQILGEDTGINRCRIQHSIELCQCQRANVSENARKMKKHGSFPTSKKINQHWWTKFSLFKLEKQISGEEKKINPCRIQRCIELCQCQKMESFGWSEKKEENTEVLEFQRKPTHSREWNSGFLRWRSKFEEKRRKSIDAKLNALSMCANVKERIFSNNREKWGKRHLALTFH